MMMRKDRSTGPAEPITKTGIQDRRLTASLHLYWHLLKKGETLPSILHFSPAAIPML